MIILKAMKKEKSRKESETQEKEEQLIDPELLEILACPKCKGDIELDKKRKGLICKNCKLLYKIEDGIPIMLIDEAVPI